MDRGASVHGVAELDPSELLTLSLFFFFFPTKAQFHKTAPSLPTSFSPYIHISDTNGKSKLSPVFLNDWAQVRVSQDPLLRFQRFAGALPELRETFYLIDCWLIVKGCNSTTAWWKRCSRQGIGKQVRLPGSPETHLSPQISTCLPTRELSESRSSGIYGGFTT